jgi:catechol 2,3-dioxygenase-like lactoylglutathione lyase family enzyme
MSPKGFLPIYCYGAILPFSRLSGNLLAPDFARWGFELNQGILLPSIREDVMKIVPVIKSGDLERSVLFYTRILDFERKWPGHEDREVANGVIDLIRDGAELQLSRHAGDGVFGSVNRVFVDDVDERYVTFATRGLDTTLRPGSPIHTAPVDQTWGLREFAVTDPDGNGLCFCMPIE